MEIIKGAKPIIDIWKIFKCSCGGPIARYEKEPEQHLYYCGKCRKENYYDTFFHYELRKTIKCKNCNKNTKHYLEEFEEAYYEFEPDYAEVKCSKCNTLYKRDDLKVTKYESWEIKQCNKYEFPF